MVEESYRDFICRIGLLCELWSVRVSGKIISLSVQPRIGIGTGLGEIRS